MEEITFSKNVIQSQVNEIYTLKENNIKQEPGVSPPNSPCKPLTRPRNIPVLELHQLEGLEASACLQIFFELVEQCSNDGSTRVQIAKSRLSQNLAVLIHNKQAKNKCKTWVDFRQLLCTEFAVSVNLDRAWQELDSNNYDWAESPQSFTNRFICQYAILETRFPHEKFPNQDKTIKRKIWHGLTKAAKVRLEGFLDEEYALNKFIDWVEHERQILLELHTPTLNHVQKENVSRPDALQVRGPLALQDNNLPNRKEEIKSIKKQIQSLTENMQKLDYSFSHAFVASSP